MMQSPSWGTTGGSSQRPALFFADAAEWAGWLQAHHASAPELWMGLRKKHVVDRGLTWEDAVVEALRYGWIDSVAQRIDDDAMRQRWTPRRKGSIWSAVNVATARRLIDEGRMAPAGLAAFEARRPDRVAIYAYEQGEAELTDLELAAIRSNPAAMMFWEAATPSYRRTVAHWIASAKRATTRQQRAEQLVADCAAGRLVPTQRYGRPPAWVGRVRAQMGLPLEGPGRA